MPSDNAPEVGTPEDGWDGQRQQTMNFINSRRAD